MACLEWRLCGSSLGSVVLGASWEFPHSLNGSEVQRSGTPPLCWWIYIFFGPNGTSTVGIISGKDLGKSNATVNEQLSHRTRKSLSSQAQANSLKLLEDQVAVVCSHWRAQMGESVSLCFILLLFEMGFVHDEELYWWSAHSCSPTL